MKFTPSTYSRHDREYKEKAIDALARMEHGQNATVEFHGNKVIVNGGSIMGFEDMAIKAIDRQSELTERPELEQVYHDRQKRVDQAEKYSNPNMLEKSPDEMMQAQAQAYMRSNSSNSNNTQRKATGLPSERT